MRRNTRIRSRSLLRLPQAKIIIHERLPIGLPVPPLKRMPGQSIILLDHVVHQEPSDTRVDPGEEELLGFPLEGEEEGGDCGKALGRLGEAHD
jgi:hypothetical protein